jgi:hypothetical protein
MSTLDNTFKPSGNEGLHSNAHERQSTPFLPMMALVATGGMALFFLGKIPLPASPQVASTVSAPVSAHMHAHGESMPEAEPASDSAPALQPGATLVSEPEPAADPTPAPAPVIQPVAVIASQPAPVSAPAPVPAPVAKPVATPAPAAPVLTASTAPANAGCGPQGAFPEPSWYAEGWSTALSGKWPAAFDLWENGLRTLPKNRAVIVGEVHSDLASFSSGLDTYSKKFPVIGIRQQNADGKMSYRLVVCPYGGAIPGKMLPEVQTLFPGAWLINASSL